MKLMHLALAALLGTTPAYAAGSLPSPLLNLANGSTATTQASTDTSADVATDSFAAALTTAETTRAEAAESAAAQRANNLSDLASSATARSNIGAAASGSNSDIHSLTGLTTPLTAAQGGTGTTNGAVAPLPGGWKVNRWYAAVNSANFANIAVGIALRPYATPVYVPNNVTVKQIGFYITTANSSAWNARLMVFADTGAGAPGSAVIDSGAQAIAASASGVQSLTLGTPVALSQGWYWFVFISDTTAVSVSSIAASSVTSMTQILGSATATQALWTTSEITGVYGATLSAIGSTLTTFGTVSYPSGGSTPQIAVGL